MTPRSFTALRIVATISLCAAFGFAIPAAACGWTPEYSVSRYPAFQFIDTPDYGQNTPDGANSEAGDFWADYTGNEIDCYSAGYALKKLTTEKLRKRDTSNDLIKALAELGDTKAFDFLELEMAFQDANASWSADDWEYEKPETSAMAKLAVTVDKALDTAPKKLFGRYLFLDVRIYTALHDYKRVIGLWDKYSSLLPEGPLKERIRGYLGGAFYHTGRYFDALEIFAQNGEGTSLGWCLQKMAGIDNLEKLLKERPNSLSTMYVLQDYANYLWMLWIIANDLYNTRLPGDRYGNAFRVDYCGYPVVDVYSPDQSDSSDAREIEQTRKDLVNACDSLIKLADKALADKKVAKPMVWAEAKALALLLTGKRKEARHILADAPVIRGTSAMLRNLDRLSLWADLATLDENDLARSTNIAARYTALYRLANHESYRITAPDFDSDVYIAPSEIANYAFLHDVIVPYFNILYRGTPQHYRALAMRYSIGNRSVQAETTPTADLPVDGIGQLLDRLEGNIPLKPIDQAIFSQSTIDKNPLYDALGRASLVGGDYERALGYFDRVSPYWSALQDYNAYLSNRSLDRCVDFGRKQKRWETAENDTLITSMPVLNHRAITTRKLIALRDAYLNAPRAEKARAAYDYAKTLYQISAQGDLWAVSDNANSILAKDDQVSRRALSILEQSLPEATDPNTKAKILYGIASISPSQWFYPRYADSDYRRIIGYRWDDPSQRQLDAYRQLAALYPSVTDPGVRRCDVLRCYVAGTVLSAD